MAKIPSIGAVITIGGSVVGGVDSFTIPEGDIAEIDVTTLDSDAKEYVAGLADNGTFTISGKYDKADAGQVYCRTAANQGGAPKACSVAFSDGSNYEFNAILKAPGASGGGVDSAVEFSVSLRISGEVTWAAS